MLQLVLISVSVFWLSATTVSGQKASLRILPLGDSITYGYYSSTLNGYRQDLLDLLSASNVQNATYVGSTTSGTMEKDHNSGFPGATISVIEKAGLGTLDGSVQPGDPDLVLLHAGTNDAYYNHTARAMISDLRNLLDEIYHLKPDVCVVLSEIIMNKQNSTQSIIKRYNAMFPDLVHGYLEDGKRITLVQQSDVNLYTDDNPQHLTDPTHPGDIGFAKMARNFFYGIQDAAAKGWIKTGKF